MFGVDTLKSYAEMTCDSLTPDFVSYILVRTYDFLVVTTSRKSKSSKRLRRGGAFVLSPCLAKSSRYPPQTWASAASASVWRVSISLTRKRRANVVARAFDLATSPAHLALRVLAGAAC